jgi:GntR family transcriptional regulator, carbon starvation induced regulator
VILSSGENKRKGASDRAGISRLAPGTRIRINEVAQRFEVSSGAVCEALPRLTAESLTITQAHKGFQKGYTVAPVSNDELVDLTKTRISIEHLCLRDAIGRGGVDWEAEIVATCHRLSRIPERASNDPGLPK